MKLKLEPEFGFDLFNIAVGFLGIFGGMYGLMSGNFVTGEVFTITGLTNVGRRKRQAKKLQEP